MGTKEKYESTYRLVKEHWDQIAKPLDSLGKLETMVAKLGAIQETEHPKANKVAVLVLCSDNGVVEEGISQSDQSVTALCTQNIAKGMTTVGIMAKSCNADVIAVDLGVAHALNCEQVISRKIRMGTRNFAKEPAMTIEELHQAFATGMELVKECKEKGYELICIGEMGIGNTTTSAAVAASLLQEPAKVVTGKGAGLSSSGLLHKVKVVEQAIANYDLYHSSVEKVLQCVGGYDIAGMVGVYLGAKKYGMPVLLDGAISMVAALAAKRMEEDVTRFLIPSHKSREPLVEKVCNALEMEPILDADMALGEGTGAVLMVGVLQTALRVYEESVYFADSGVEQYSRLS